MGLTESKLPLISVVVITYHSAPFLKETLESILKQSYDNIELIISDDGSKDETLKVAESWIESFGEKFKSIQLIKSENNTGTPSNCNRGLYVAKGEWVKFIAGDDVLHPDFFKNMQDLFLNPEVNVIAGAVHTFESKMESAKAYWPDFDFPMNQSDQKRRQIIKGLLLAPSVVLRTEKIVQIGGFDNQYVILEDDPMWFKLALDGNLFHFAKDSIVYYRQHSESVNSISSRKVYYRKPLFLNDLIKFGNQVRLPAIKNEKLYFHAFFFYLGLKCETLIYKNGSKLDNYPNKILKKLTVLFNKIYLAIPFK